MTDLVHSMRAGGAHMQYALHIYGYPYVLCSHQEIADYINGATAGKADIFGSNVLGEGHHYDNAFAIPNAISIPSRQSFSLSDTSPVPDGGDWSVAVCDRDYGLDWSAGAWDFTGALKGIIGVQCIPEISDPTIIAKYTSSTILKGEFLVDVVDAEEDLYGRINDNSGGYLWIGNECVWASYVSHAAGITTVAIAVGSRGCFRSPDCSHYGSFDGASSEIVSAVPIGSISGRGCALWAVFYDDLGDRELGLWKLRHGRVKSRSVSSGGAISISCSSWHEWLRNEQDVNRIDARPAKYIFTRGSETSRGTDSEYNFVNNIYWTDSRRMNKSWRAPHLGVVSSHLEWRTHLEGGNSVFDSQVVHYVMFDIWLCDNNSYVVFDTLEDVLSAVQAELTLCQNGKTTQHSGVGTTESPYIDIGATAGYESSGSYRIPIINQDGMLDVKFAGNGYDMCFYGVIPGIFGLGAYDSEDEEHWEAVINSLSFTWGRDTSYGSGEHIKKIYPIYYGQQNADITSTTTTTPKSYKVCDWSCEFYWDANYEATWKPATGLWVPWSRDPMYSWAVPKQIMGGYPYYRLWSHDDLQSFREDSVLMASNAAKLTEDPVKWSGAFVAADNGGYGTDGFGYIDCDAADMGTWQAGAQNDLTLPAIVCPNPSSDANHWPFDQWTSMFYVPRFHDEYYGGSPIVLRTGGGGWFAKLSSPFKAIFGSYGTGNPIGPSAQLDFIPDISGDTDHHPTIDWDSLDDACAPITPGQLYTIDVHGSIDVMKALSSELMLHGVIATWELDCGLRQHIMRFKPAALVNGTDAIQGNRAINNTNIEIGTIAEIAVNDAFRYNKLLISTNKSGDDFRLKFDVESKQIKGRMGRSSKLALEAAVSWIPEYASLLSDSVELQKIKERFQDILYHIGRDYPSVSVNLTGKAFADFYLGADCLYTDPRVRDPYTGRVGISGIGARVMAISHSLDDLGVDVSLSLIGQPVYGWAPAVYLPAGYSYYDSGDDKFMLICPTAAANWFSSGSAVQKPDLCYFRDWRRDDAAQAWVDITDTDFKVLIYKRHSDDSPFAATLDSSTLNLFDIGHSYGHTVETTGLDIENFTYTTAGDRKTISEDLIMTFQTTDNCELPQLIYATYSDDVGQITVDSVQVGGTRWQ